MHFFLNDQMSIPAQMILVTGGNPDGSYWNREWRVEDYDTSIN
jgi:hypothetical protein